MVPSASQEVLKAQRLVSIGDNGRVTCAPVELAYLDPVGGYTMDSATFAHDRGSRDLRGSTDRLGAASTSIRVCAKSTAADSRWHAAKSLESRTRRPSCNTTSTSGCIHRSIHAVALRAWASSNPAAATSVRLRGLPSRPVRYLSISSCACMISG